ncbi:unnamed protein product [Polarella glacialis]|uniref:DUF4470 domain-containing protein n=1 Tax=Polarella glacialis TaxID=89957 RepID=A0A813JTP0_POLGL|nr:unnamed protein product [Polarella glacialis]
MDAALWTRVLDLFKEEAGDLPSEEPEGWEHCLLARLAARELGRPSCAKKVERLLLQKGQTLADCRRLVGEAAGLSTEGQGGLKPPASCKKAEADVLVKEAQDAVAEASDGIARTVRSRSRSRRKAALLRARSALQRPEVCLRGSPQAAATAASLLSASQQLRRNQTLPAVATTEQAVSSNVGSLCLGLSAPACLGPPAFFPVGNAAGRFEPLTRGLLVDRPRLLFVGISDPRHLLAALPDLPKSQVSCVLNDLNAETCARNAIILGLLGGTGPRGPRVLAAFVLWWMHDLPASILPLLAGVAHAAAAGGACCPATSAVLRQWASVWSSAGKLSSSRSTELVARSDLQEVISNVDLQACGLLQAADEFLHVDGEVCLNFTANITLQHQLARLDYGLHAGHVTPTGWEAAGDGVLLWPESVEPDEFDPDVGQPPRAVYLLALSRLLPRFVAICSAAAEGWLEPGHAKCEFVAGDCLTLPEKVAGGFHRIFTSNVADHVGVPALALGLGPLLVEEGQLRASLSNNLRALCSSGDAHSLFPKLHGVSLEDAAAALGFQVQVPSCAAGHTPDQVRLVFAGTEALQHSAGALKLWPAECARRLYRCPKADITTIRRRAAQGEVLGMAHRYARRFTCSPITVKCISRLLERAAIQLPPAEAAEAAAAVKAALPHSQMRLSQCLNWQQLPTAMSEALAPEVQRRDWRRVSFEVSRDSIPSWAWRTHPAVVLLWVRPAGFQSAAAAGVKLAPQEPVWHRCRKRSQLAFLEGGVWGPLRWALQASPEEVQVLDGVDLALQANGHFQVTFALEAAEREFGLGGAAFILSLVDNVIVTGPHEAGSLQDVPG